MIAAIINCLRWHRCRAKLTRNAYRSGDMMRKYMRESQ